MGHFLRFIPLGILFIVSKFSVVAQPVLQDAGTICCDQDLCPGDTFPLITELTGTTPADSLLNLEYAWYSLLTDASSPSGTKWVKLPNTNSKQFQPTNLGTAFGGFYMRAVREVGTLPYLFSNVVSYVQLSPSNPECQPSSATNSATAYSCRLFPNPTQTYLQLEIPPTTDVMEYRILTSTGILAKQAHLFASQTIQIAVDDLPAGAYLLQIIEMNGKRYTQPWIKI